MLKEEGYIDNFVFVDKEDSKEDIRLYLRYNENSPAITTIEKLVNLEKGCMLHALKFLEF